MSKNAFNLAQDARYDPKYGINGRVKKDEFSIDGKSWNYRDPQNKDSNEQFQADRRGDDGSAEDNWSKNAKSYANPLYDYSYGQVRDAAKELDIGNVKSQAEVDQLLTQIRSGGKSKAEDFKDDFIDKKIAPRENSNTEVEIPTGATAGNAKAGDNSIASPISQNSGTDITGNGNNKVDQSINQNQAGDFLDKYKLSLNTDKGLKLSK
jgi:hypothetical protein